jgi:hypothetical protein
MGRENVIMCQCRTLDTFFIRCFSVLETTIIEIKMLNTQPLSDLNFIYNVRSVSALLKMIINYGKKFRKLKKNFCTNSID